MSETVLSGIRATGRLHFGNFLGAVRNFVQYMQGDNACLYFIADWHTLTTLDNPEELRGNRLEIVKDYLAAGLDPERAIIYAQSSVPEIAELCLYLSMIQPLGALQLIPTYKDLVKKNPDRVSLGLITYPVLMAADILGPKATLVPVGEDQLPNIELARELARRFNDAYGEIFPLPQAATERLRVPGLDGSKMGKSESNNAIGINDPIETIRERYLRFGITDEQRLRRSDPGRPYTHCKSVFPVHEIITPETQRDEIAKACMNASIGCTECKQRLVDNIAAILEPFQNKRRELADQDDYAYDVITTGGRKARELIIPTIEAVRDKVGITWRK